MVGRSSGRYLASHPSWYRKQKGSQWDRSYQSNFENRTVADTVSSFEPDILQRLYPLPDESHYSQPPTIQQKMGELKLLLGKFSSPQDAHKILEWANIRLRQGDEGFLMRTAERVVGLVFERNLARVDAPKEINGWLRAMLYKPEYTALVH